MASFSGFCLTLLLEQRLGENSTRTVYEITLQRLDFKLMIDICKLTPLMLPSIVLPCSCIKETSCPCVTLKRLFRNHHHVLLESRPLATSESLGSIDGRLRFSHPKNSDEVLQPSQSDDLRYPSYSNGLRYPCRGRQIRPQSPSCRVSLQCKMLAHHLCGTH